MSNTQKNLTLDEYQAFTRITAIYPKEQELPYLMFGIMSEIGEVADKLKKQIRDRPNEPRTLEQVVALQKELGDVLWYLARLTDHLGLSLQDTMAMNVKKLTKRTLNDAISGSGDDR